MTENLPRTSPANPIVRRPTGGDTLADVLERVLDKGIVIVGDIGVNILDIELLTLRIRLLIASADTAREMGIDWWTTDPFLSSKANGEKADGQRELGDLRDRIGELEAELSRVSGRADASKSAANAAPDTEKEST